MTDEVKEDIRIAIYDAIKEHVEISENATLQELNETLLHAFDASVVARSMRQKYKLADSNKSYYRKPNRYNGILLNNKRMNQCEVIVLCIPKTNNTELFLSITCDMERLYGWYLTTAIHTFDKDYEGWLFEKKIYVDVTHIVKSKQYLYCLVPTSYIPKITHVGLRPRKTSWEAYALDDSHAFSLNDHDRHYGWKTVERVYVYLDKPEGEFLGSKRDDEKDFVTDSYALMEIDVAKLKSDIKFHYDPRNENAFYTTTCINASAIKVCE